MNVNKILLLSLTVCFLVYGADNDLEEIKQLKSQLLTYRSQLFDLNVEIKAERAANQAEKNILLTQLTLANNEISKIKYETSLADDATKASYNVLRNNFDNLNNKFNRFQIYSGLTVVISVISTALLMSEPAQIRIKKAVNNVKRSLKDLKNKYVKK